MTPKTLATASVRSRDQYAVWRDWFWPLLEVVPAQEPAHHFAAENHVWALNDMAISRVSAPAVRVVRSKLNIRRNPADHWVISYCRHGSTTIATDRASLKAAAGAPFIWSLGEESRSERTAVERIQIFIPRDSFAELAAQLDHARGSVLDTPLGCLLGDFMLSLERQLPELTDADIPRLTNAIRCMVSACVSPSVARITEARNQIDFGRRERVRRAVRQHLRSPRLKPASLSRLVGISRSNLYRLFDDKGGVARYIQLQRLLDAHAALSDPVDRRSIAAISDELCFSDASSFSRAFRREFGYSPTEVRCAMLVGMSLPVRPQGAVSASIGQFSDILVGL